ncbi:uncharacterized protein N7483_000427 [Penicillium malachiteum]|uniref:uncharacterized protein n=1 Tax=Penicillium malachiteum TaxID=1324776 RepID=UPI0025478BFF|nr:uncharacterized protein N7483_000427 [Penicillium malachiteum]KAJ5735302.1 hypothetical protein N7483_000427 [Penicillium malachiteum]
METFGVALPDNGVFHAVMTGKPYKYECWLNDFNSVPVVAYTVTRTLKVRQWWYCETNCTGCSTKDPDHISLQ